MKQYEDDSWQYYLVGINNIKTVLLEKLDGNLNIFSAHFEWQGISKTAAVRIGIDLEQITLENQFAPYPQIASYCILFRLRFLRQLILAD